MKKLLLIALSFLVSCLSFASESFFTYKDRFYVLVSPQSKAEINQLNDDEFIEILKIYKVYEIKPGSGPVLSRPGTWTESINSKVGSWTETSK